MAGSTSTDEQWVEVTAGCHCGKVTASTDVPKSSLPLQLWLCSCTTCRVVSGQIALTVVLLGKSHTPFRVTGRATRYATSSGPGGLQRCFCPDCGASVFEDSPTVTRQSLYSGSLRIPPGSPYSYTDLFKVAGSHFNGDARDGALAPLLPGLPSYDASGNPDSRAEYAMAANGDDDDDNSGSQPPTSSTDQNEKTLKCRCRCGGVSFRISRPNAASLAKRNNLEGVFYPHLTDDGAPNPDDIKWWIRGEKKDKYAAQLCMCNSCRRVSGHEVQAWAFVPDVNLRYIADADAGDEEKGMLRIDAGGEGGLEKLAGYNSSPGVTRWFCGGCGATVFFTADGLEGRDGLVDVSVGLMRGRNGSRVEDWLEWAPRVSYAAAAQNEELRDVLSKGVAARYAQNVG